jgi:hypothetical protein
MNSITEFFDCHRGSGAGEEASAIFELCNELSQRVERVKHPSKKLISQSKRAIASRKIKQESDMLISRFEGLLIRVLKERADILGRQACIRENRLTNVGM